MGYSLVYDKSVLLLPQSTSFSFSYAPTILNSWKFNIMLSDDTTSLVHSSTTSVVDNVVTITLFRWYSDTWVENNEPIQITSKDGGIKLFLKIRLTMNQYQTQKHIIVSLWKQD